jgi:hypothetical protein
LTSHAVFWLAASRPDAETIRRWAREITAGAQPTVLTDFWNRALAWLAEQWLRILGRRVATGFAASFDVLAIVALAVVVAVMLVALLRARRLARGRGGVPAQSPAAAEDEPLDWQTARDAAAAHAAAGAFRDAVRLRYRAMLLRLDAAGRLPYVAARTNGEALAAARGRAFFPAFREATRIFDHVWYGMRPADAATFGSFEAHCGAAETGGLAA